MMTSVSGYYDGNEIVMDELVDLWEGQRLIITILDPAPSNYDQRKHAVNLDKYTNRGQKMFSGNIEEYVIGLRTNDRI